MLFADNTSLAHSTDDEKDKKVLNVAQKNINIHWLKPQYIW